LNSVASGPAEVLERVRRQRSELPIWRDFANRGWVAALRQAGRAQTACDHPQFARLADEALAVWAREPERADLESLAGVRAVLRSTHEHAALVALAQSEKDANAQDTSVDRAFGHLTEAVRFGSTRSFLADPTFASLQSDPRFAELVRRAAGD